MPAEPEKGDLEAQLASSTVVLDEEYASPDEQHSMMGPHAATVTWDGGRLEVVDSNQGADRVRSEPARMFSLDASSMRGALRTHRRRLRRQGPSRPPGVRRHARGHDEASGILSGRIPQPHRHRRLRAGERRMLDIADALHR